LNVYHHYHRIVINALLCILLSSHFSLHSSFYVTTHNNDTNNKTRINKNKEGEAKR